MQKNLFGNQANLSQFLSLTTPEKFCIYLSTVHHNKEYSDLNFVHLRVTYIADNDKEVSAYGYLYGLNPGQQTILLKRYNSSEPPMAIPLSSLVDFSHSVADSLKYSMDTNRPLTKYPVPYFVNGAIQNQTVREEVVRSMTMEHSKETSENRFENVGQLTPVERMMVVVDTAHLASMPQWVVSFYFAPSSGQKDKVYGRMVDFTREGKVKLMLFNYQHFEFDLNDVEVTRFEISAGTNVEHPLERTAQNRALNYPRKINWE